MGLNPLRKCDIDKLRQNLQFECTYIYAFTEDSNLINMYKKLIKHVVENNGTQFNQILISDLGTNKKVVRESLRRLKKKKLIDYRYVKNNKACDLEIYVYRGKNV